MKDVVVVGGGIAGLTAAHALRDLDLVVLEAADRAGGRIFSEPRGENWLNFGAHVFGGESSVSGQLLADLGVTAVPVPGRLAAVSLNGRLVSRGSVESFPFRLPMPVRSRAALVRTGIRLRLAVREYAKIAAPREGEEPCGPSAADARVHGRPLVRGVLGGAARGRRPPLPLDADALLGRAGGACGRLRRRLLPPRLGQEGRALAEHPRRLRVS